MTKTPQHNVPELRFPEFEGEWEEKKLGDIASFSKGKSLSKKDISENGVACILYGELYTKYNAFIDEIYSKTSVDKSTLVQGKENQILIPSSGETSEDIATASCLVSNKVVYIGGDINIITPKKDKGRFISLSLNSVNKNEIAKFAQGKSVVHLYNDHLKKTKIKIPNNLNEQEKIGTFFSKLDRQIELEEEKLELLEQQKKGYMQKIFSQQLRFKDENGNEYPAWNKTLIKDIFIFENNRRKPITSSLREKGNYPYYGATGIIDYVKDYLFDNEERLLIGEDGAKWGQFETSSFIANGKYWVNNHAHVVKSNDHNLYFMNYYLNFKELRTFVTGNAPAKLTHANLCSMSIEMPIRNEQDKISHILKGIENRINKQNIKIQLLQQRKQGLLQKMFV
ncbi:restriction endonuclease subunit S [Staphylococcus chromogenes]|nr:restriction endonuclease subunit S [Staphylococcus chromogenes]MDU0430370.1 restriction endonuclease subunit S [Staphylococcus chromogenes]